MKKLLQKTTLLFCLGLFIISCSATKKSCGLSQIQKTVKQTPVNKLSTEVTTLKAK